MSKQLSKDYIERWGQSLCEKVDVAALMLRHPIAHKWRATYRSLVVREMLLWRMHDLAKQVMFLADAEYILGARILLRSALETLAILVYLNFKTDEVISNRLSFFDFAGATSNLLLGSRNGRTPMTAINVMTMLGKLEPKYTGLVAMHEQLSESAHPNYDGVCFGYSSSNPTEFETKFENKWQVNFGKWQEPATNYVLAAFEHEYNVVWPDLFDKLEQWLVVNDATLENEKNVRIKNSVP